MSQQTVDLPRKLSHRQWLPMGLRGAKMKHGPEARERAPPSADSSFGLQDRSFLGAKKLSETNPRRSTGTVFFEQECR